MSSPAAPRATRAGIDCLDAPVDGALWLARAFADGRRLTVWAPGAEDHAHHVAVEFVHPVVVGTRPLPASVQHPDEAAASDAVMIIGETDQPADLTLGGALTDRVAVRTYHLLWELVHVALEHPGLVGTDAGPGGDPTGFLYPFLDASEEDEPSLRRSLEASAEAKVAESGRLATDALRANEAALSSATAAMTTAVTCGKRILAMGNGGSATDAARLVRHLRTRGLPAEALSTDYAVLTALANDLGTERIFARQVEALGSVGDVLVGCSTSGASPNLLAAFDQAAVMGLTTIGLCGYGGGSFVDSPSIDHTLAVDSLSVHRIQEVQAALIEDLCARVGREPAEQEVVGR